MKAHLTLLAALLLSGTTALAQEEKPPFPKQFSVEIATGIAPIHTIFEANGTRYDRNLSNQGKEADMQGAWTPALSLSAAWRTSLRWEMVLTGGISWCHHKVIQYGTFGIDPKGNPRYDLQDPHPDGWRDTAPSGALFFQARRFWNPAQKVKLYSAIGFGLIMNGSGLSLADDARLTPVPSVTPIAVRFGTGHLTFFVENTYSPAATCLAAGLGWTF